MSAHAIMREVLAALERAQDEMEDAVGALGNPDPIDNALKSSKDKRARLVEEIREAQHHAAKAEATCRTLLRIEERYLAAKQTREAVLGSA